jgi:hypothetical protein
VSINAIPTSSLLRIIITMRELFKGYTINLYSSKEI